MGKELEAKLFKKYSSDMIKAILNPVEVAGKLYASEIIDAPTRDRVTKSDNGANDLIIAVEAFILSQPVLGKRSGITSEIFKEILEIFKKYIPLNYVVKALEDEYHKLKQEMDSKEDNDSDDLETLPLKKYKADPATTNKALPNEEHSIMEISLPTELTTTTTDVPSPQNACYNIFSDPHVKHLAEALKVYSSDLNESELESEAIALIKARIEAHIKKRSEERFPKESIKKHLTDLTMNALIPSDIVDWCYETLDKVYADFDASFSSGSGEDPEDDCSANCDLPPLFSKDTVYHASLCLLALSHHPSQSSSTLSDCGHSFDSISFSITNKCKMMIAQQGDIVYISFANDSDPHIHKVIPMRYFCELLHQDKRLIFTGYSHGCGAAQNILECLWKSPFFNRDVLLQNTACIMFGACYDNIIVLYSKSNDVNSSSHLFLLEGELLNFFYRNNQISKFRDIFYLHDSDRILNKLNTIIIKEQEGDINYERLQEHSYSIHRDDFHKPIQGFSEIEMKDYHLKILRGYLEKAPDPYSMPPRQDMSSIKGVQSLIPSISRVELHQHEHPKGYELAVVINGDNLWFCREIKVIFDDIEDIEFKITPECVTQKQISYNFPLKSMITFQEVNVQVAVFSTFHNLSPERYSTTYSIPDPISFRQSQLAKQTPSQIIQLSFLSALLEQSPSVQAGKPTKRFTSIIKFLQESARIVPLESITSAIAGCDDRVTACKYAQAFLSAAYSSPIPVSKLMASGCQSARSALGLGGFIRTWGHHRSYVESDLSSSYTEGYHTRSYMEGPHYTEPVLEGSHYSTSLFVEGPLHYNRPLMRYSDPVMDPPASIRYSSSSADYGNKPSRRNKTGLASPLPSAVVLDLTENRKKQLLDEFHPHLISHNFKIFSTQLVSLPNICDLICGRNIGEAYPISEASYSCSALTPLPMVLQKARCDLAAYSTVSVDTSIGSRPKCNSDMLETVNNIINNDLKPCVTMLGGFMEQQIRVPLVNNPLDTAKAIITAEKSGAVGVWALFAMSYDDIARIPRSRKNQALVIQITKFIKGLSSEKINKQDMKTTTYNAKLQFLLQGMRSTISCSYEYISYSLERELVGICKQRNISTSTRIDTIVHSWDVTFKSTALTLVSRQYRPLLARWLIWALNIHQLRETLASYTTVGVIGLVNSGKSTLVNKVFKIKTVQGDTQSARTTVPLIYNLDNEVEGLSVIDFPGVDDRDDSIGKLAELLVGLAQIVIFVCEYKRFHTKSAEEWMDIFHKKFVSSPILVCLTNADRLYEEKCDDDMIPSCPEEKVTSLKMHFERELETTIGSTKAKMSRNCDVKFCSLTQSRHSPLNKEEGRQSMRKVGILTPQDVGDWIKHALEVNIQQKDLADKLGRFLAEQK